MGKLGKRVAAQSTVFGAAALVLGALSCGGNHDSGLKKPEDTGAPLDLPLPERLPDQVKTTDPGGELVDERNQDVQTLLESGCATATAQAQKTPVYMLVVLDASDSMVKGGKWTAAKQALEAFFDATLAKADPGVGVGLVVFSDASDATMGQGPYPTNADVPVRFVDAAHRDWLKARLNTEPAYGTPTESALVGGLSPLRDFDTAMANVFPGGRKVLVLASDGEPNPGQCSPDPARPGFNRCETIASQHLQRDGIRTFAMGIGPFPGGAGTGYDPSFMGYLSIAGGTRRYANCDPLSTHEDQACHLQITPGDSVVVQRDAMLKSLNRVRSVAAGCAFALSPTTNGVPDPSRVNVVYKDGGGKEHLLFKDGFQGWSYDDESNPTKVILNGNSCTSVSEDPEGSVRVLLGCKSALPK